MAKERNVYEDIYEDELTREVLAFGWFSPTSSVAELAEYRRRKTDFEALTGKQYPRPVIVRGSPADEAYHRVGSLVDGITLVQAACLVLVKIRTVENRKGTNPPPKPRVSKRGTANVWRYAELRPWLLEHWPGAGYRLPESYAEAKRIFSEADA